jgi:radical SAM protein with 4Fe4S-binding SPASM domain
MKRPYGYMNVERAKHIISDLKSNNICNKITFHVMGEPTLHPDFFVILDYAQEKKMNVGLTTNGAGLDGNVGKRLIHYNLHQLDISLQTPDERSFTLKNARNSSFKKYIEGIFNFLCDYNVKEKQTIFKFRFLNTRFLSKDMDKRMNSISINSSDAELHENFHFWAKRIYDFLGVQGEKRERALEKIKKLVTYKWNVVEIYKNIFFETYLLRDWIDAYEKGGILDAWGGYCFGMRDHFSILYNGDVTLCCVDINGNTTLGNIEESSLKEILSSPKVRTIMNGFKTFRFVHPYCKKCQGSRSAAGWLLKPVGHILGLKILKPFFYSHHRLWE